jgi:steroid delta-isomerase-like uncharacterized protein
MTTSTTNLVAANLAAISQIYSAFGRGDIAAILDRIAPDCRWEFWADNRGQRAGLPTMQQRVGPAGVSEFFVAVKQLEMHDFQLLDTLSNDHQVVAEVEIEYTTPAGQRMRDQELHLWTLDEQQRVMRMRHYVDTAKHIAAFGAQQPGAMTVEENKKLARRFVLEHNQADYRATFGDVLAGDCVLHEYLPGVPESMDRQAYEHFIAMFRAALPDIHNSVDEVVVQADAASVRWTGRGTHTGDALMGVPASGNQITAHGVYVLRIVGGKIVEAWDYWDNLNVLQQLGGLPTPT